MSRMTATFDLGRFMTSELESIEVSKGYTRCYRART